LCNGNHSPQSEWSLPTPYPIASPPSPPPAPATNEPDDQQQQHRPNGGIDDCRDHTAAEVEAELWKEPSSEEGAGDAYNEITNEPESGASHDLASKPSANEADNHYDQETFTRHVHLRNLSNYQSSRQILFKCYDPTRVKTEQNCSTQRDLRIYPHIAW
jgi:hypothetical protein